MYRTLTVRFLVMYINEDRVKDFIKLPEVFIGDTFSEAENRNAGPEINITLQLLRPSKIHKASCPDLNGTAVPQSIDLQA